MNSEEILQLIKEENDYYTKKLKYNINQVVDRICFEHEEYFKADSHQYLKFLKALYELYSSDNNWESPVFKELEEKYIYMEKVINEKEVKKKEPQFVINKKTLKPRFKRKNVRNSIDDDKDQRNKRARG
ncbi:hypothetical protein [Bacillus paramycoides]|uniref:hypothetical protein n=1 Tax=Bacillus paramycoides TaxID=2026194 RepID=UPI002E24B761|nr:hypothetical protein [Bacillus paramycoides]MED1465120.1 hypothetical protein [Bacillus paramycoides]MED1493647.1 hypothetical protein [Bacillus paramycoides]